MDEEMMREELVQNLRLEIECAKRAYPQGLPAKDIFISAAADAVEELRKQILDLQEEAEKLRQQHYQDLSEIVRLRRVIEIMEEGKNG